MKKASISICLTLASLLAATGLSSCGEEGGKIKVGIVCIGDENATYDKNFMNALDKVAAKKNIQVLYKTNVPEQSNAPYEKAVELAEAGCKLVISNSYGFEDKTILAAKEYPNVLFAHCTGDKAHTEKLNNYCNGFASIYEGRYLAGIAAGMKLKEMGETCLGYVGAFNYAEVISGFTAFYLGAKSIVENATMLVQYTSNWGNTDLESGAATNLLGKGAKLISQHADTYGAPTVCNAKNVFNVSYNVSTEDKYPETYLSYSAINWAPWFEYLVECVEKNEKPMYDFTSTLKDGGVVVGDPGKNAAPGTKEAMDKAREELIAGTRHVFDCSTFTVDVTKNPQATVDENGHMIACMADIDNMGDFQKDTQVVEKIGDKYVYQESVKRSAPSFDVLVDGITVVE